MKTLKENIITVEDIKAEIEKAEFDVPREDEDFGDRYDRLHAEWAVKGLKKYRDELKETFADKDHFKDWVIDRWGNVDTFIAVINEELRLRSIESIREASECAALMKIFIPSESGSRDEAEEKVKRNLEEALEEHDQRIINIFDVEIVPLLQWNEELLAMKAFLTNDFYMKGSFSDKLKEIYTNVFTLLDRNLPEKVEYSDAHSFEYYVDLEDEWEYLYLDDLNPVEELLAILPGSPYECDVMYYAHSINWSIKNKHVNTFKEKCKGLYNSLYQ
ncbi:hypothetical protein [uncultured Veillonella sp.]|uniref:hypothetical protein n=1 Tax=uncultured Veillonella sp. TaxID=159268 RepID=UPI00288B9AF2|nr:hypothetical protein [uncultured Veillonella sp.]MDU2581920.1 hypothetical protein [Veillonella sp.]MDU3513705.1 hypothetical protein [Veillonella sp.]